LKISRRDLLNGAGIAGASSLSDRVMPIDDTSRKFVPRLEGLGYDVTYREYEGGHGVPAPIVHEGFEWLSSGHR
jgi:hypothetical protein